MNKKQLFTILMLSVCIGSTALAVGEALTFKIARRERRLARLQGRLDSARTPIDRGDIERKMRFARWDLEKLTATRDKESAAAPESAKERVQQRIAAWREARAQQEEEVAALQINIAGRRRRVAALERKLAVTKDRRTRANFERQMGAALLELETLNERLSDLTAPLEEDAQEQDVGAAEPEVEEAEAPVDAAQAIAAQQAATAAASGVRALQQMEAGLLDPSQLLVQAAGDAAVALQQVEAVASSVQMGAEKLFDPENPEAWLDDLW